MKRVLLTMVTLCILSHNVFCQELTDIGKIVLGIAFQDECSQETIALKPQLKNKLSRLATRAGCSSFGEPAFVICPDIIINDVDVVEGGMKNIYSIQGELYISVMDRSNRVVFATTSHSFKGSGTDKTSIIRNAILNVNYTNLSSVFDEAKRKILSYYQSQKELIFSRADAYAQKGAYDEAITCLMVIPEELVDIQKQSVAKAMEIYKKRELAQQKKAQTAIATNNSKVFIKTKSLLAMHKPTDALRELWNYKNGDVAQQKIYDSLVNKAESMISATEKAEYERLEREYQDKRRAEDRVYNEAVKEAEHRRNIENREIDTHQQSIDAMKTIACDFLKNNPNFIKF